jgi:hypothetical protein
MSRRLALALLVAGYSACGHPTAPEQHPGPPHRAQAPADAAPALPALDQDLPRLAARAVELYAAVAGAFDKAGMDCVAATAQLAQLEKTYADVVAATARVLHAGRARELRAALEPHQEKYDAVAQAIVKSQTMATCAPDHAFEQTFDRLVGSPP